MRVSTETLQNRCGDDEVVFGGQRLVTLTAPLPSVMVATVCERTPVFLPFDSLSPRDAREPPIRPPLTTG